jgi:hypothetical protein
VPCEKLAGQQSGDAAAFVATTKAVVQVEEEKRVGEALLVVNQCIRSVVGSRQTEEETWAQTVLTAVADSSP